jgi:FtsP/CotA-like multicopper oxidase with cupredoxin domain
MRCDADPRPELGRRPALIGEEHGMTAATTTALVELEARPSDWEIAPGHRVNGYAFNGEVPGPTIEARVGEELVVVLKNGLPEPTVIHWHGLRVPAEMDGTDLTQELVKPGETFEYRFTPPDAGTFWYHSHANETEQVEKGLYGALIVRGEEPLQLDGERVLVFDDLTLNGRGQIARFGGFEQRHDGRQGATALLNGRTDVEFVLSAGQVERWRCVNASSARYVRLSIGGSAFLVLGTDGGLLPSAQEAREVLLTPGERVDLAVGPFPEGDVIGIESLPYTRGAGWPGKEDGARFGTVRVGPPAPSQAHIPTVLRTVAPLVSGAAAPTRSVILGSKRNKRRGVDFLINGERHHMADPVKVGELQVWDIVNETHMEHPFHLHGFFFQVLDENGRAPSVPAWKDTVNLRGHSTVRIAWMPDDRPGRWMCHCHILEHHQAGMMATFRRGALMSEHRDVIVIGGGQPGLAVGYHLARQRLDFSILEGADVPATAWRERWDSLLKQ